MIDLRVDGVRVDGKPLILRDITWDEVIKITTKHPRWSITVRPDPAHGRPGPDQHEELG
jgi:hypothetical protein